MKKFLIPFVLMAAVALLVVSCGETPTKPTNYEPLGQIMAAAMLPEGAVFESADLHIFISQVNGEVINIYRITDAWEEMVVTFNNFGGAYDPTVMGSFTADAIGWKMADVSGLVEGWVDGDYENFGLLLDQDPFNTPRASFHSREYTNVAYLEVCYSIDGEVQCMNIRTHGDSYIWEVAGGTNFGAELLLRTGWVAENDKEKQSLLMFDIEPTPDGEGCSHTIGYWKTHDGEGPQDDEVTQYLPIWLGDAGGAMSLEVVDVAMSTAVLEMKTYGKNNNGITKLYAQLLGAKLSIADGADGSALADVIADADAFLADHDHTDWDSLTDEEKDMVEDWKDMADDYNNGFIGPGHCDDEEEEEEEDD